MSYNDLSSIRRISSVKSVTVGSTVLVGNYFSGSVSLSSEGKDLIIANVLFATDSRVLCTACFTGTHMFVGSTFSGNIIVYYVLVG